MRSEHASRVLTVRVKPDEHRRLRALAREHDRSVSNLVRVALKTLAAGGTRRDGDEIVSTTLDRTTSASTTKLGRAQPSVRASELLDLVVRLEIPLDVGSGSQESQVTRLGLLLERLYGRRFGAVRVGRSSRKSGKTWRWKLEKTGKR